MVGLADEAALRAGWNTMLASIQRHRPGLVLDGLHFAANDFIEVQAAAGSTHLTTSLKDLQKLGVDSVSLTGSHNIDLGAVDFSVPVLPHFGNGGDVTLVVNSGGFMQIANA